MPPTPTELSLQSLLPTIGALPPELLSLANSLLSQSKSKVSNLKPEEEVGRIYAVCHIAAERLRDRLNLEIGKPAPPVKPRVYTKLKGYLDGVLVEPSTPRGRRGEDKLGSGRGSLQCRSGEMKEKSKSAPTSLRKKWADARKPVGEEEKLSEVEVPQFVMGMINHLCKETNRKSAQPHIYVGVSEILRVYLQREEDTPATGRKRKRGVGGTDRLLSKDDIAGVAITVFFLVVRRMNATEGTKDSDQFFQQGMLEQGWLERAQGFCTRSGADVPDVVKNEGHLAAQFKRLEGRHDVWMAMDWFNNVPKADITEVGESDNAQADMEDQLASGVDRTSKKFAKTPLRRKEKRGGVNDVDDLGPAGLLPGFGTMFQPAVDWLSDENVRSFDVWKKDINKTIAAQRRNAQEIA